LSYFRLSQRCDNRKGWLFSDTPRGAKASAIYYTLIESAKANGLDPYKYLLHLYC
jgi:transposase